MNLDMYNMLSPKVYQVVELKTAKIVKQHCDALDFTNLKTISFFKRA